MRSLLTTFKYLFILTIGVYSFASHADGGGEIWSYNQKPGVSVVEFKQYDEICGSCHFPFQPGLLPTSSWEKIMTHSDNHFGERLKLSSVEKRTMTRYLLDNSAGHVNDNISHKILKSLNAGPSITQITKTPYFLRKHSQLDDDEKTIKSMVQCDQCHQDAKQGKY